MTPKQRQRHIQSLQNLIAIAGFTQDKYGNYLKTIGKTKYRFKFKKVNLRFERKISSTWQKISSKVISQIKLDEFATSLVRFINQIPSGLQPITVGCDLEVIR